MDQREGATKLSMIDYISLKDRKRELQRYARTCIACRLGDHDHCSQVREPTRRQKWIPCQCEHVNPKIVNPYADTGESGDAFNAEHGQGS